MLRGMFFSTLADFVSWVIFICKWGEENEEEICEGLPVSGVPGHYLRASRCSDSPLAMKATNRDYL